MGMKSKLRPPLLIAGLVVIDMVIKLVIDHWFMNNKILINQNLGFVPFLNTEQLSIFNRELSLDVSLSVLIFLNCFLLLVWFFVARRVKKEFQDNKFFDYTTIFLYAGGICSLFDKIFWGGSLDYLLLFNSIVDLKDLYLVLAIFLCFIAAVIYIHISKKKT